MHALEWFHCAHPTFVLFRLDPQQVMGRAAGETEVLHLTKAEEEKEETFRDKESGADLEVQEKQSLLEWLANNYKKVCRHLQARKLEQHG